MITELKPHQIFVFGSNRLGHHIGGAAKQANVEFGAEWGIGEGLSGKTYAFPTLEPEMTQVGQRSLEHSRDRLYATCRTLPEKEFLLTKVGCGIANHDESKMKVLFTSPPENLILPEDWRVT